MATQSFLLRVRHNKGTLRLQLTDSPTTVTIKHIKQLIEKQLTDHPTVSTQILTLKGKIDENSLCESDSLLSLGIKHGDMIYLTLTDTKNENKISGNKRKRDEQTENDNHNQNEPTNKRAHYNNDDNHNQNHNQNEHNNDTHNRNMQRMNNALTTTETQNLIKHKPKKKAKKKSKKKKDEFPVIYSEGTNATEIAANYLLPLNENALSKTLNAYFASNPESNQNYTAEARTEAIFDNKVQITEYLEPSPYTSKAKSRGKRYLIISYSYQRRKRKESVCFYSDDMIQEIITQIIAQKGWKSESKNVRKIVTENWLNMSEMAKRSPALLWSIVHSFPNQDIQQKVVPNFVKSALKQLR